MKPTQAPAKKAPAKKAPAKKAPAKKAPAKKKSAVTSAPASGKRKVDTDKFYTSSTDEILAEIMAKIGFDEKKTKSKVKVSLSFKPTLKSEKPTPAPEKPTPAPEKPTPAPELPRTKKDSLPLVVVAAAVAIIIAGFWGPQIVRSLGIPIDPKPFTAIYFQDPTVVQHGIVAGDLIVIGVHNGFRNQRNLAWHADSSAATITRGQVLVNANSDSHVAFSTTGALPGQLLKIYIEGTSAPITIQVVG